MLTLKIMQKLEKLNSSIDIIPLQQMNMDGNRRPRPTSSAIAIINKQRISGDTPLRDPMIIARVKQVRFVQFKFLNCVLPYNANYNYHKKKCAMNILYCIQHNLILMF